MIELGDREETLTGTPQDGILSPLLANIALSVLDDHFDQKWRREMGTEWQRKKRRQHGQGNHKIIRYADLCRRRHKSAYAEARIMPTWMANFLASGVLAVHESA